MPREHPPTGIVAQAERLVQQLQQYAREHRRATLAEHEQAVLALLRQVAGPILGAVVEHALGEDQAVARRLTSRCPSCQRRRKPHSQRERQVVSVCGAAPLRRWYYWCRPCHRGWSPADQTLGLQATQRLSPGCVAWLSDLGGRLPFGQAAEVLEALAGIGLGKETVRTHAEATGQRLVAAEDRAAERVEREREAAEAVEAAPGMLVVEVDGVMVRYLDGWHEVKVGLVAGCEPGTGRGEAGPEPGPAPGEHRLSAPSYVARRAPAAAFGPLLLAEAARRGALDVVGWETPPAGGRRAVEAPALARTSRSLRVN